MKVTRAASPGRLLLALLLLLVGCSESSEPRAGSSPSPTAPATSEPKPSDEPPADPCADHPPPFEATYLPEGFKKELRTGAGLFKGAGGYPTDGLLGHYAGPVEVLHVNFETRPGPLPYVPANPHPLNVLGERGRIGKIEGGWAVEFSLDGCKFRMDIYGLDRVETVKVARGLREAG